MVVDKLAVKFDRRQHPRFVTAFEADLTENDDSRTVIVGDISAGGCLLEDSRGFHVGRPVHLRAIGLDMPSRITWVRGDICGVRFTHIVDPLQIIQDNMTLFAPLADLIGKLSPEHDADQLQH